MTIQSVFVARQALHAGYFLGSTTRTPALLRRRFRLRLPCRNSRMAPNLIVIRRLNHGNRLLDRPRDNIFSFLGNSITENQTFVKSFLGFMRYRHGQFLFRKNRKEFYTCQAIFQLFPKGILFQTFPFGMSGIKGINGIYGINGIFGFFGINSQKGNFIQNFQHLTDIQDSKFSKSFEKPLDKPIIFHHFCER